MCSQHHAFFSVGQLLCQFTKPPLQSYSETGAGRPCAGAGQPLPTCWQHHIFFPWDHSADQLAKPAAQSYNGAGARCAAGQPLPECVQHQAFLAAGQLTCHVARRKEQSGIGSGAVLRVVRGGGRDVGSCDDVGTVTGRGASGMRAATAAAGADVGAAVVVALQARSTIWQQKTCFEMDHASLQSWYPVSQSNGGALVAGVERSQSSSNNESSKQHRELPIIRQLRWLLGRAMSKSPPSPTYL